MVKKLIFCLWALLGVIGSQNIAFAGTVSFDQLAVSSDLTAAKYNSDLNTIFQDHNTNIGSTNIADDSVAEADMADDANPRIRDYELGGSGTECQMVYTGLLTTTTSGTLTGSIPSGTAYPRGYRVVKSSNTSKTWTASKWTYYDIDINGNFNYSEVAIGSSAPSVASNSIRIARVSTDGTQVAAVTDLRTTSCTSGNFTNIGSASGEPTLDDVFKTGSQVRQFSPAGRTPQGFAQGAFVSWDTHTTFKVTGGSLYINGEYRTISTDTTVPTTADDPANGVSGIDTGAIAANTRYYVYAIADQDGVKPFSVSFSTSATTPSAVTNYRLIGSIRTDASSLFTSQDVVTAHAIGNRELPGAWCYFNGGSSAVTAKDCFNVSSITYNATGDYTLNFTKSFRDANINAVGVAYDTGLPAVALIRNVTKSASTLRFTTQRYDTGALVDSEDINILVYGDTSS